MIVYTTYAFGLLFSYCEFGEQVSSAFELLYDDIYYFDWHLFPLDLQLTWNIMLFSAQQPVQLVGFGNIACNRESFKRVSLEKLQFFNEVSLIDVNFFILHFRLPSQASHIS